MTRTIGTCSLCGGPVTVPTAWYGAVPPVPQCAHCGATKAQPHGPVIEMDEPPPRHSIIGVGAPKFDCGVVDLPYSPSPWLGNNVRTAITHWSRTTL